MEDTTKLKTNDLTIYQDGVALLDAEKAEDERARAKYGTDRWSRPPSTTALAKLYQTSKELQTYLNSAGSSDSLVQTKFRENEHILQVLTGTNRDLERFVPSSDQVAMTPAIEQGASRLRTCLNEVSRLETRRKNRIAALKEKAKSDDIGPALLSEAARLERQYPMQKIEPGQFEKLFETRLESYEPDREALITEQEEQDQVIARLREANKAFLDARRGDTSTRDRQRALQALDTGYAKYKELISNLDTGRKFYNDLASHVTRFRENCKTQVAERRVEASQLEAELAGQDIGRLNLEETRRELTSQSMPPQTRSRTQQASALGHGHGEEALTAPVPTRNLAPGVMPSTAPLPVGVAGGMIGGGGVWTPDMGIRFGGGTNQPGQAGYPGPRRP